MTYDVLLLDMDEVLADFLSGALAVHGWNQEDFLQAHPVGQWSILPTLGLTEEAFWGRIDAEGPGFWTDLPPLPWFDGLVRLADTLCPYRWYVVTSPSRSPDCVAGKREWITRYLGDDFDRFVFTSHKHLLANPSTVLLDDRADNVCGFRAAGGHGILFPSNLNMLRQIAHNPLSNISPIITSLFTRS